MFARLKTVKGKKYAYLVENRWVRGKVRQKVKKYLGPVLVLDEKPLLEQNVDFSKKPEETIKNLAKRELLSHGFKQRKKRFLEKDSYTVNLETGSVRKGRRSGAIYLNGAVLYSKALKELLTFEKIDEEKAGTKLAKTFSDAGIRIHKHEFVELYKKIYL